MGHERLTLMCLGVSISIYMAMLKKIVGNERREKEERLEYRILLTCNGIYIYVRI